jgi:DNA (cytosine-5)-methyltransferase 1
MIAIDLFSGPGGMSLGLEMAGFKVKAAVEFDRNAAATYRLNHPTVKLFEQDIITLEPPQLLKECGLNANEISLIAGGPPCQGFSMANGHSRNRLNPDQDKNNQKVVRFIEFVEQIRPRFFIMENVLGFLSLEKKFNPTILQRFKNIGYSNAKFLVLNALDYGVPQNRRRVFIIGSQDQNSLIFEPEKLAETLTVSEALFGDLPQIRSGSGYPEGALYSKSPKTSYQFYLRNNSEMALNHITTKSGAIVRERFSRIGQGKNGLSLGNTIGISIKFDSCYKRLKATNPAITMSNFRKSMIMHPTQNRIISVREAARLQSFPDSYIFSGGISSLQQQVGDAVPPLLAKAVGSEITKFLD